MKLPTIFNAKKLYNRELIKMHLTDAQKTTIIKVAEWLALIGLPAIATLWMSLSGVWGIDPVTSQRIAATITAIDAFLGSILGVSEQRVSQALMSDLKRQQDAILGVESSVESKMLSEASNLAKEED